MKTINFLNTSLIFTPEVFILCKQVWGSRGPGAMNFYVSSLSLIFKKVDFQHDFVSKLNETISVKLVPPTKSTRIFFRKDGGFV